MWDSSTPILVSVGTGWPTDLGIVGPHKPRSWCHSTPLDRGHTYFSCGVIGVRMTIRWVLCCRVIALRFLIIIPRSNGRVKCETRLYTKPKCKKIWGEFSQFQHDVWLSCKSAAAQRSTVFSASVNIDRRLSEPRAVTTSLMKADPHYGHDWYEPAIWTLLLPCFKSNGTVNF
jgi:hypothetical protein